MTLHYTKEEQDEYEKTLKEVHFQSLFGFLNAHNGFRRGCMHLAIGTTGGGKSTLTRSIIRDVICNNGDNVLLGLWLSEETISDYKQQLSIGLPVMDRLLKTDAQSELEFTDGFTEMRFFEWLEFTKPDIVIFDNITTSKFYMDKRPDAQAAFATKLKNITKKLNFALVLIAHTDSSASDSQKGILNINHIRGAKTICNLVEFAYILQRFEIGQGFFPTLRVVKSRSQELLHSLYLLKYENKLRSYVSDSPLEFKKFKEAYGQRNRLD